ncbi:MAG: formimidoylglutamate deiminase [Rhodospirillales bacterium]
MTTFHFETALLPAGWADNVEVEVDRAGFIARVTPGAAPAGPVVRGAAVPGMPNLHSHAFQRAMAGLGEVAGPARDDGTPDSFWTWRQVMYGFVRRMTPDDIKAVALKLYVDMLKAGYTGVCEFHYLHHGPDGGAYAERAETSMRLIDAAHEAGIGITMLPVLYAHGGFGGEAPSDGQRRFINDADGILEIIAAVRSRHGTNPNVAVGLAPHSLRAVTPELLADALDGLADGAPVHVHIAEQTKEVDDCLKWSGSRPVEWLLDHVAVGPRWCLVHATHMTDAETQALARSGAVAGLCPTTEANLGDGLFPAETFTAAGGHWGIGSDSHISVSPKEELRWFEYGQRLTTRRRNVLADGPGGSTGAALYLSALMGGAQASARPVGAIAEGMRADVVVLDTGTSPLSGRQGDALLDAWLFAADHNPVSDVIVGGVPVVTGGVHAQEEIAEAGFQAALKRLQEHA